MKKYLTLPNALTFGRLLGGIALLFLEPVSTAFFVVYTFSGISDGLDGFAARRLGLASQFGARLDSVADLTFFSAMLIRVMPVLWRRLPRLIWYFVGTAVLLRLASYFTAAVKYRKFASLHTWMNKLTGFSLFFVPYLLETSALTPCCAVGCLIGNLASFEELVLHLTSRSYDPSRKSLLRLPAK